jgi:hypothetical protein
MLVFLFGNACTNIHVFGNGARSVCDCNYTQQFRYLGHIDTSPRASGRDFFERENHHARLVCVIVQRMSFIFIVYRLDPAHANCQNFGLLLSTTVTFLLLFPTARSAEKITHIIGHLRACRHGRRFCAFPFGPTSIGNFSFAHFAGIKSKLVSICMYRA